MSTCPYALGCQIELITAKRLLAEARGKGQARDMTADQFYDPHAAFELGRLIDLSFSAPKEQS